MMAMEPKTNENHDASTYRAYLYEYLNRPERMSQLRSLVAASVGKRDREQGKDPRSMADVLAEVQRLAPDAEEAS
jgi:hypothetical protein